MIWLGWSPLDGRVNPAMRETRFNSRSFLIVGVSPDEFARYLSILARAGFDFDRFPTPKQALTLIREVAFDLILVRVPLDGLELADFLGQIRNEECVSRRASVILLSEPDYRETAKTHIGRGANSVVNLGGSPRRIQAAVSKLLRIADRKSIRFTMHITAELGDGKERLLCQTENISSTGMLLHTDRRYPVGTRLSFDCVLPESRSLGVAEVVRYAVPGRDGVGGMALRFLSFSGESHKRLETYLDKP